jgi:hypothetical protein
LTTVQHKLHSREEQWKQFLPLPHRPIETRHTVFSVCITMLAHHVTALM